MDDSFPPYGALFRRRFGIAQRAGARAVPPDGVDEVGRQPDRLRARPHARAVRRSSRACAALIAHFDDLNRAHEAVLKAQSQVALLQPLVADCERHAALSGGDRGPARLRATRCTRFFAFHKPALLARRQQLASTTSIARGHARDSRSWKRGAARSATGATGSSRPSWRTAATGWSDCDPRSSAKGARRSARDRKAAQLRRDRAGRRAAGRGAALEAFVANQREAERARADADGRHAEAQNRLTEPERCLPQVRTTSTRSSSRSSPRCGNGARTSRRGSSGCGPRSVRALGLDEEALPFAGELVHVRDDERAWEGAAERLLHGFALALLVPDDALRGRCALGEPAPTSGIGWCTSACGRPGRTRRLSLSPEALARKLEIKPDSCFYSWLETELARRFDHACLRGDGRVPAREEGNHAGRTDQGRRRATREGRSPPPGRSVALRARLVQRGEDRRPRNPAAGTGGAACRSGGGDRRSRARARRAAGGGRQAVEDDCVSRVPGDRLAQRRRRHRGAGRGTRAPGGGLRRPAGAGARARRRSRPRPRRPPNPQARGGREGGRDGEAAARRRAPRRMPASAGGRSPTRSRPRVFRSSRRPARRPWASTR